MNISAIAKELIWKIDEYKKESSKKEYVLDVEEEIRLFKEIEILKRHIEILSDYELKRNKEEEKLK